jgi:hypothetical protein
LRFACQRQVHIDAALVGLTGLSTATRGSRWRPLIPGVTVAFLLLPVHSIIDDVPSPTFLN